MTIKIRLVVATCSIVGALLAAACAQKPPELTDERVSLALEGWSLEHSAPFWKALGKEPPKPLGMDWTLPRFGPLELPTQPANPQERAVAIQTPQLIMLRGSTGQFISFSGNGIARFRLEQNSWYLVHVEFTNGVTVEDIHWKVEND